MTRQKNHDVGNHGEREIAGSNDWRYYAHLSIYRYFSKFVQGKRILEIGSGTGYGANYLSEFATDIVSIDVSPSANTFCRDHATSDRIDFQLHDLSAQPIVGESFPVIVSSNAFEHIAAIDKLLENCSRILLPDGLMLIAVPPVNSPEAFAENFRNPFHVNNLTPTNWYAKLSRYFDEVKCFRHWVAPAFQGPDRMPTGIGLPASQTTIREGDFVFQEMSAEELHAETRTITALFSVRQPRQVFGEPSLAEELPRDWHVGKLCAQVMLEEVARRERELKESKSWRVTAPLRAMAEALRAR